jgi:hypothetical protein
MSNFIPEKFYTRFLSLSTYKQFSKLHYNNFRQLTCLQSDDIRCCINTIRPPEDEQRTARNMGRILIDVLHINKERILCKMEIEDARSANHQRSTSHRRPPRCVTVSNELPEQIQILKRGEKKSLINDPQKAELENTSTTNMR